MRKELFLLAFIFTLSLFMNDVKATTDTAGVNVTNQVIAGTMAADYIKASSSGVLQSVGINWQSGTGNAFMVAIYSNGTNNKPGALLTNSTMNTVSGNNWMDASVGGIYITSGTGYWLALQANGGHIFAENSSGPTLNSVYLNTWTFGTPFDSNWNTSYANSITVSAYNLRMTYQQPIENCTYGNSTTPTLNYTVIDENSLVPILSNVQMTHSLVNWGSYSFNYNNQSSFANCIYPSSATYSDIGGVIMYTDTAGAYTTRYVWIDNMTLTNTSQPITLYLLNNTAGTNVQITLKDASGNLISNAYLWIQRYYPSTGKYGVVEVLPMSEQGTTNAFLQLNTAYYQFLITEYGQVLGTISQQLIPTNNILLNLNASAISPYLIYWNQILGNVTYNPTTGNLTANYTDSSGYLSSATFTVTQVGALQTTNICSITNTSLPSGQISCYIGNATGQLFGYSLTGTLTDGNTNVITSKSFQYNPNSNSMLFGNCNADSALCQEGAIITFFILIVCAFMGLYSPTAAMILTCVGLGAAMVMGLFVISIPTLVGLFVIAGVVIFKLKAGGEA